MNGTTEEISRPFPPVIMLVTIFVMLAIKIVDASNVNLGSFRWVSIFFIGFGVVLNISASKGFKKAGTAIKPTDPDSSMVVTWPYSFTRNPMYLGMTAILTGVAIALGSPLTLAGPIFFVWYIQYKFILKEERKMEAAFGSQYIDYKKRVRRWI